MSNGQRANLSGKRLENHIASVLDDFEYSKVLPKHFFDLKSRVGNPIYARQCYVGTSIYNRRRRVDIILHHPEKWADCLIIQCKWQSKTGSVDEKYPFEVLSIDKNSYSTIIVLDGGGYSSVSGEWLRSQAGKGNLIQVCNLGEFDRFATANL
ncbi:MAG: hypothetical protein OXD54_18775 [Candidatus Poribacteria bacterium]|nr:hypothetical protein [Candidatus Poribacteria bacterium]